MRQFRHLDGTCTWMVLGTFVVGAMLFAYIAFERSRGADVLALEFYRLSLWDEYDDRYPAVVPPDALKEDVTFGGYVFGNTVEVAQRVPILSADLDSGLQVNWDVQKMRDAFSRLQTAVGDS